MIKLWHFDVIAAGRLVVVDGHDDSCLAPPIENQVLITSEELKNLEVKLLLSEVGKRQRE